MRVIKKILGWLLKAIAALAILIAIIAAVLIFLSRQERAIAKDFVSLAGQEKYTEAHALLSESFKAEYPLALLQSQFEKSQVYDKVSFNSVNMSNGQTVLAGNATTKDGCTSPVMFVFEDEAITAFRLDKPCLTGEQSA